MEPYRYQLAPGHVIAHHRPTVISLELGSAVAVCVWDRELGLGGVSHFRQPGSALGGNRSVAYGRIAVPALIGLLTRLGGRPGRMEAQLFGGGHRCSYSTDMGRRNVRAARRALARAGIPIVSQDVGGRLLRHLLYHTGTNQALCLKSGRGDLEHWHPHHALH